MEDEKAAPEQTIEDAGQRQLELYARDLEKLYWSEKLLRSALAEEKLVLEYKINELNALNRLFQANLEEERLLRETHVLLVQKLKQVLKEESGEAAARCIRNLLDETETR